MSQPPIDKTQLRALADEGLSHTEIGKRLGLPRTTVRDRLKRLDVSAAHQAKPPVSTEGIHDLVRQGKSARYSERLDAMMDDLGELVAWWQTRKATLEQVQDAGQETRRVTFFVEKRWEEAIRRQADLDGQTYTQVVNRAFQVFFGQK